MIRRNELLEYEREQHSWSREELANHIGAPEPRMIRRWEREGVLPNHHYRRELASIYQKSPKELGLMKNEIPFWNVPYRRNPFFTGRDHVLTQLRLILEQEKTAALSQVHAITGLGGIGKTQLAIEYAYRYGHEYQAVFWVRADSREALVSDLVELARLLRLPESDAENQKRIIEAVQRWFEALSCWLLILDNVEDLRIIGDFLPLRGKGHTLLTTRMQFTGTIARGIDLDVMDTDDGTLFLLRRAKLIAPNAPADPVADYYIQARELTRLLGGLPLALDQAGAYIEETGCSVGGYLEIYRSEGIALLQKRGMFANGHPKSVVSTLFLSFEKLQHINPLAALLLQFLAFLHPDAIPEEIISGGASELGPAFQPIVTHPLKLNALFRSLYRFSLIRRNTAEQALTVHRLVQAVLTGVLDDDTARQRAGRTVCMVNRAFPEVQVATWSRCERYLVQALLCADLIAKYRLKFPEAARLLDLTGRYLYERGRIVEADPLLHRALAMRENVSGPEHFDTTISLNNLALLYHAQGKYEQAEPLYARALQVRTMLHGADHPDTAIILHNLAALYHAQGKYEQAEATYQQALQIREQTLGPEHPDTAISLDSLAVLYADQGKFGQAELLGQRVLAIKEQILEPDHPDIAISLSNLAGFYHVAGKYARAEPLYQRARAIFEKVLGSLHLHTATSLDNLAGLYADQGNYIEAEMLSQQALKIKEKTLGPEHPEVYLSLITLASVYQALEKYEQAETLYQRALAICEKTLGMEHAYTAGCLTYLATLYTEQGKYEAAEPFANRALEIKKKALEPEHASLATSLDTLAAIYHGQGKNEQAEVLCRRALTIREKVLEPQHLHIAASLLTLATIYIDETRYNEAEPLVQRALAIREQNLGPEHPEVMKALEIYLDLLAKSNRQAEASELKARIQHARKAVQIPQLDI